MLPLFLVIINLIILIVCLTTNGFASVFSNNDVGSVSGKYELLNTPATWTFAIWGIIYTLQIIMAVLAFFDAYGFLNIGISEFALVMNISANILNSIWIPLWVNEILYGAMIALLGIAGTLAGAFYYNLSNIETFSFAQMGPIGIYFGWVIAAALLNVFIVLKYSIPAFKNSSIQTIINYVSVGVSYTSIIGFLFYWIYYHTYELSAVGFRTLNGLGTLIALLWALAGSVTGLINRLT